MGAGGELGHALRSWRERLDPPDDAAHPRRIRRTPGLRREELAAQAGVSVDYLTRLEQGRAREPSEQVLLAVAGALQLSDEELGHLFELARKPPPLRGRLPADLTSGAQRLLDHVHDVPMSVYDPIWNLLAWNTPFAALMGEPAPGPGRESNVVWSHFNGVPSPVTYDPAQQAVFERAIVADLRAAVARYRDDPQVATLVEEMQNCSPRFVELWEAHVVGEHSTSSKTIRHPEAGHLHLHCDVLTVPGGDLRMVLFTAAPGSVSADRLRRVLGTVALGGHDGLGAVAPFGRRRA